MPTPEDENDFMLIDQVELKFALSSTESQLQGLMHQFLAPLIRKAATGSEPVRAKVVSLLSHILKRVSATPGAKIPGFDLVTLLTASSSIGQVLAIKFLDLGASKLSNEEQSRLIVTLTNILTTISNQTTAASAYKLIIQMIPQANLISTPKEEPFNIYLSSELRNLTLLCKQLYRFFLHGWSGLGEVTPLTSPSVKSLQVKYNGAPRGPTGLLSRLKSNQVSILKYLAGPISDHPKWPFYSYKVFLAGSVSSFRDNVEVADGFLKRVEKPDLESLEIVNQLFEMDLENEAPVQLKIKLMDMFIRSQLASENLPQALKVIFDGLHGLNYNSKLRVRSLLFMQSLIRKHNPTVISQLAPVLLSGLFKILDQTMEVDNFVLGGTYVTIGLLATQAHSAFQNDLAIVSRIMNDLQTHRQRIPQIKDALSMMLVAYKQIESWGDDRQQSELLSILEQNTQAEYNISRLYAFRYLVDVFPIGHVHSRFLCILGSGDVDSAVREAAIEGLKLGFDTNLSHLDPFELVDYVHLTSPTSLPSHLLPREGESTIKGLPPSIMLYFLLYTWSLSAHIQIEDLLSKSTSDPDKDYVIRERLGNLLNQQMVSTEPGGPSNNLKRLLSYLMDSITSLCHPGPLQLTAVGFLCQIIWCGPVGLISHLASNLDWFKSVLPTGTVEIRSSLARSHAIVLVGSIPLDQHHQLGVISPFLAESMAILLNDKSAESKLQVSLMTLGYLIGRFSYRFPTIQSPTIDEAIDAVLDRCKPNTPSSVLHSALLALRECGRYYPLPKHGPDSVLEVLRKVIYATSDTKIAEAALLTLGHLGVGNPKLVEPILPIFFDIPYPLNKNVEVYFRAGEAIACLAGSWKCPLMAIYLDIPPNSPPNQEGNEIDLLEKVIVQLKDAALANSPNQRKGAAFCLLSIVKYCYTLPKLTPHFKSIHSTFISLLTNPDELVQEVASTGMSIIYDHSLEEEKGDLVKSLMSIFNNGLPLSQTMAGNGANVFSSGGANSSLGRAPDGSQINTYSSIMSLAADMNQPELIYPFLQLARSNAVWASRQGAAFGLTRLLGPARVHIAPYIASFLPRLYRYRYDPDSRVAQTMDSIWNGLVSNGVDDGSDANQLLNQHFHAIISDLLKGMGDRSWRTRQSSATALSELLHGRREVDLAKYMDQVWLMSFRAMDDVKESVREAGLKASRSSLSITLKYIDKENNTPLQGADILNAVLPFLLEKGIFSDAEEVRTFSIHAIIKIVSLAKVLLKPHLVSIITNLLDAMTAMESDSVNYLSFHVDKYHLTQEELDGYRLADLKKSPLCLAIGTCIPFIDSTTLDLLMPELITKIRRSVGFATKAGCARLVAGLISDLPQLLLPHSSVLLKAMMVALGDPSIAIRKLWAATIGAFAPYVEFAPLSNFLKVICEEYIHSGDEKRKCVCAITCLEISRKPSAAFTQIRGYVLPFAYFGKHDGVSETARIWDEVWRDITTGTTAALLENLDEILGLVYNQFDSTSWVIKQQSAKSLGEAAKILDINLSHSWLEKGVNVLLNQLSGRLWEGKECLLAALAQVVLAGKDHIRTKPDLLDAITKALLRDIKKNSLVFKTKAIQATSLIVPALEINCYADITSTLLPYLSNNASYQDDDISDAHLKPRMLVLKSQIIKCLFSTLPSLVQLPNEVLLNINDALGNLHSETWNVRLAALEGLENLIKLLSEPSAPQEALATIWPGTLLLLKSSLVDQKYIQIRLLAVQRITELANLPQVSNQPDLKDSLKEVVALGMKDPNPQISESLSELKF